MRYWEEVRKNHYILKIIVNIKEYELCDLYITPSITNINIYKCYIGESICNNALQPISEIFSAYDLETAKAKAEVFVMQEINKKKGKLESEIYRCDKILGELK